MRFYYPLAAALCLGMGACTTQPATSPEIEACKAKIPVTKRTAIKAIPTSCLVKAALYKSIGKDDPSILMCAAGGAAGFMLGDSVDTRRCSYRIFEDQLNGEIAHTKKMNGNFATLLSQKQQQLSSQQAQIATLQQQKEHKQQSLQQKQATAKNLDRVVQEEKQFAQTLQQELAFKSQTLQQSKQAQKEDYLEREQALTKEITLLRQNIKKLRLENEKLSKLQAQLSEI